MLLSISFSDIFSNYLYTTTLSSLPSYGISIVAGLIVLFSLKEILSASEKWDKETNSSFYIAIIPLLIVFFGIVVFKIISFVQS